MARGHQRWAWPLPLTVFLLAQFVGARPDGLSGEPWQRNGARAALSQHPGQSDPLEFAIVGDINGGMETFESVIARLREERAVDFPRFARRLRG